MSHAQELLDQISEQAADINAWDRFGDPEYVTVSVDRRAAKALAVIFELGSQKAAEVITEAAVQGETSLAAGAMAEALVVKELLSELNSNIKAA